MWRSRTGRQPLSHFPLDHDEEAFDPRLLHQHAHDHRNGHVVRKVGGHRPRTGRVQEGTPVGPERVGHLDADSVEGADRLLQRRREPPIDLDRQDGGTPFGQSPGERAEARADFQHVGVRPDPGELRDAPRQGGLDEEMLPQGLLRPDPVPGCERPQRARGQGPGRQRRVDALVFGATR